MNDAADIDITMYKIRNETSSNLEIIEFIEVKLVPKRIELTKKNTDIKKKINKLLSKQNNVSSNWLISSRRSFVYL